MTKGKETRLFRGLIVFSEIKWIILKMKKQGSLFAIKLLLGKLDE